MNKYSVRIREQWVDIEAKTLVEAENKLRKAIKSGRHKVDILGYLYYPRGIQT
jgi:hypothetical protein